MKKALTLLAGALLVPFLSSQAWADDEATAKSVNAVGVVKYTIPAAGGMACISVQLDPMGTDVWKWGEMSIAEQLPVNSTVYFWDGISWTPFSKTARGWNNTAKAYEVHLGESFFVQSPKASTEDITLSLLGELPTDESLSYSVRGSKSMDMQAATMYPVAITNFGSTELASALGVNSTVYFWDGASWGPFSKTARGWNNTAKAYQIKVGEGMFIQEATTGATVRIERPFDWE